MAGRVLLGVPVRRTWARLSEPEEKKTEVFSGHVSQGSGQRWWVLNGPCAEYFCQLDIN